MGIRFKNKKGEKIIMNCFMCKGELEDKNTTFMIELDNCIIIIKNMV